MSRETVTLSVTEVEQIADMALRKIGVSEHDVQRVLPILMYAQKRASTQGLIKIIERTVLAAPDASAISAREVGASIVSIDGNGQIGMVVMTDATHRITALAQQHGLAMAATRGTASSTGAIGYYTSQLAGHGLIGIVLAGSPKTMAAYGGVDPVMGTNPIAISIPMLDDTGQPGTPITFDMASAAVPVFGLIAARDNNETIAPDLAFDNAGKPTDDPNAALAGAIRAFGGAKGSGLALMFEILTGALTGAALPGESRDNRGNLIIAIDPARLMPADEFSQRVSKLTELIKTGRREVPDQPIRLPGEGSAQRAHEVDQTGRIAIERKLWEQLQALARSAGSS